MMMMNGCLMTRNEPTSLVDLLMKFFRVLLKCSDILPVLELCICFASRE